MRRWVKICDLPDMRDRDSRGFSVTTSQGVVDLFLVQRDGAIHAYLNQCPHTGGPLDWVPDRFLDLDRVYIQCATHDARFRIEDGLCVAGPCSGDRLKPVEIRVDEGQILMRDAPETGG